ncbi:MAG: hypothetical protein L6R36_006165 [Xanthoria steineri]|nr:MAG: hypothetical protein L6R36_006165 [Xanthoria steineri]
MSSLKGPGEAPNLDGSGLRVAVVHARWNTPIISALVAGARKALVQSGVKRENIIVQDVPGSYELPYAVQRLYAASQVQSTVSTNAANPLASDLLTASSVTDLHAAPPPTPSTRATEALTSPFDAIIAIGVLIKGETMHFEYIADATSQGLMRVQLDCGVPVVFGLLTVLTEEQAMVRAGMNDGSHCHGEDWGAAAVELGLKRRRWAQGKIV